jgi:hypothetical protein
MPPGGLARNRQAVAFLAHSAPFPSPPGGRGWSIAPISALPPLGTPYNNAARRPLPQMVGFMSPWQEDRSLLGQRRRLAAVKLDDMVGYSTRMEQDEERNPAQTFARSSCSNRSWRLWRAGGERCRGRIPAPFERRPGPAVCRQMQSEFRDQAVGDGEPTSSARGRTWRSRDERGQRPGHCVTVARDCRPWRSLAAFTSSRRSHGGTRRRHLAARSAIRHRAIFEPVEVFAVGAKPQWRAGYGSPHHGAA